MKQKWRNQRPVLGLRPYVWAFLAMQYSGMALLLFAGAGTLHWTGGWAFLILFALANTALCIRLERRDPALVSERLNVFPRRGQPLLDRILFAIFLLLVDTWMILAGIEAGRLHGPAFPSAIEILGAIVMLASIWACYEVMNFNAYLAPTVRIQDDRKHQVVTTGPYRYVRHPFYAALIPFFFGGAALMGSRWSMAVAFAIALLFAFRITREEGHLQHHLEGYEAYRKTVRYRLIPLVW